MDDSTLLVRADVQTASGIGLPFHVVDFTGEIRRSFGPDGAVVPPGGEDYRSMEIARMPDDRFISFIRNEYVVEIWDSSSSDEPIKVLTRNAPWFKTWTSFPPPSEPPATTVAGAYFNAQRNLLLTLLGVPDEEWQPPTAARTSRSERALDGRWDSIVEVIDLSTDRVVASQKFRKYLFGFAEDGSVHHLGADARGVPLWELFTIEVTER